MCFLIFVGAATVSPGYASADDEATVQARTHYLEAQKQFDLGQWDAAANEFSKAYELRPDPTFLYNMAQAYRRGGNVRRAIDLYKNYLIKAPRSTQRAEVEERIQALQRQLDDEEREAKRNTPPEVMPTSSKATEPEAHPGEPGPATAEPMAPPPTSPPATPDGQGAAGATEPLTPATEAGVSSAAAPSILANTQEAATGTLSPPKASAKVSSSRPLRIAGIITGAVGLAGIGGGILFSLRTQSLSDSTTNAKQFSAADARSGKQAASLQWVCYGGGGAAILAGAWLYWRGRGPRIGEDSVVLAPALAPAYAGLSAAGAF